MAKANTQKETAEKYELAILVKPLLPQDVQQKVIDPLTETVKKFGGTMIALKDESGKEIEVTKKHLAYAIQNHEEGYYGFYELNVLPNQVKDLEKQLKFNADVLRYLIIAL